MAKVFPAKLAVVSMLLMPLAFSGASATTNGAARSAKDPALVAVVSTCQNSQGKATAAQRVASCTILLKSKSFSSDARAHILLDRAFAYSMMKQWTPCFSDYDEALKLAPKLAVAWSEKGFARLRQHQLDMAITDYSNALALDPKTAYSWFGRGIARIGKGDKVDGQKDIVAARQLDPNVDATFARFGLHP